jgi:hypothetical protein
MELLKPLDLYYRGRELRNGLACAPVLEPVDHESEIRALRHQISQLPKEICSAILD